MRTLVLTLTLTNILLIVGIFGTVIGITHLVYPSRDRHHRYRQRKQGKGDRKNRDPNEDNHRTEKRSNGKT